MYGKIFESMFTGSLRGRGAVIFSVWSYVIASMKPDKVVGAQVELRPDLLAFYIGEEEADIRQAIGFLCEPDPDSTCTEEGGRRLVQVGKFAYRVVSGPKYMAVRNEEERREYHRNKMAEYRANKKSKRERRADNEARSRRFERADGAGDTASADNIVAEGLPGQGA